MTMATGLFVGRNQGVPEMFVGSTPGVPGLQGASAVNQTIGKQTNHSVPIWSLVRRFTNGSEAYIRKGQFVFEKIGVNTSFRNNNLTSMMNLPMVNFYLAKVSQHWEKTEDPEPPTASTIASEWVPHGVVLNTRGAERHGTTDCLINCTVRGECDTFNIWGTDVHDGDGLYFIYKKFRTNRIEPPSYGLDFSRGDASVEVEKDTMIWQIVPCVCKGTTTPSLQQLKHEDSGYGVSRYVGRVQHARRLGPVSSAPHKKTHTHLESMVNCVQFTVFIDL